MTENINNSSEAIDPDFLTLIKSLSKDTDLSVGKKIHCVNPDHDDKTPSMHIYRDHAKCFGCGYVISKRGKRKESIKSLLNKELIDLAAKIRPDAFIDQRKYDSTIIETLKIGFADEEVYMGLVAKFGETTLKKEGFLSNHGFIYKNRVIIPYGDYYFAARSLNRKVKNKNLFPKGMPKQPYIINPGKEVVTLVEGETDAIALYHLDKNTTIIGVGGTGSAEKLVKQLEEYTEATKVIIAFNNDLAGQKALETVLPILTEKDYKIFRMDISSNFKDIDELFREFDTDAINHLDKTDLTGVVIPIEKCFVPISKEEYRKIIIEYFPDVWVILDSIIAVISTLKLEGLSDPIGLNLVGSPSGNKTTLLSFLYDFPYLFHKSDDFTPKSFVSHSANVSDDDLESIDLLPKIKNRCIVIPELGPLFSKRKEDLIENIGTITRIFDGQGYESDSGAKGHRGYRGDYKFAWLAATTPLSKVVWQIMGKLGSRLMFVSMPDIEKEDNELYEIVTGKTPFLEKVKRCKEATHKFLKSVFKDGKVRNIVWDNTKNDPKCAVVIVSCAQLLRRLRAPIEIWKQKSNNGDNEIKYGYNSPLIEKPERIITLLSILAKGHAISENRDKITIDDMSTVVNIAMSSMPDVRRKFFILILKKKDALVSIEDIMDELKCSKSQAYTVVKTLEVLGLVDKVKMDEYEQGRSKSIALLKDEVKKWVNEIYPYIWIEEKNNFSTKSDTVTKNDENEIEDIFIPENLTLCDSKEPCIDIKYDDAAQRQNLNKKVASDENKLFSTPYTHLECILMERPEQQMGIDDAIKLGFSEEIIERGKMEGRWFSPRPDLIKLL
ncbi:MAG: toprim domain-containing protein [Nanoarchaeota archaeon]|nr:toprim domain-containing protein [Nanoarchaeota archaeon]